MSEFRAERQVPTGQNEPIDHFGERPYTFSRGEWLEEQAKQNATITTINPTSIEKRPILETTDPSNDWHQYAACQNEDNDIFFTDPFAPKYIRVQNEETAKKICALCLVRDECLDGALARNEKYGIWGGLNTEELEKFRKNELRRKRMLESKLK